MEIARLIHTLEWRNPTSIIYVMLQSFSYELEGRVEDIYGQRKKKQNSKNSMKSMNPWKVAEADRHENILHSNHIDNRGNLDNPE